jgi:hypothetical protein
MIPDIYTDLEFLPGATVYSVPLALVKPLTCPLYTQGSCIRAISTFPSVISWHKFAGDALLWFRLI